MNVSAQTRRLCPKCAELTNLLYCPADGSPTIVKAPVTGLKVERGMVVGDRYEVLCRIGVGSYGSVYQGRHRQTGHSVAIKMLDPVPGADQLAATRRFFREAASTARLQHPNTVHVFDFGQADNGQLFLVMEFLEGSSVARRIRRNSRHGRVMSVHMATLIGTGVLRSLGEAHSMGLTHRDIKPENIFLHKAGPDDLVVKVLDFGVARDDKNPITMQGTILGTPTYMPPEQVATGEVDARSDIYSLGIVLYECLCGVVPFEHDNPMRIAAMQVTDDPPPIAKRVPALEGAAIVDVVDRALAKKADERWQSALEMRRALLASVDKDDLFLLDAAFQSSVLPLEPQPVALSAEDAAERPTREMQAAELKNTPRRTLRGPGDSGDQSAPHQVGPAQVSGTRLPVVRKGAVTLPRVKKDTPDFQVASTPPDASPGATNGKSDKKSVRTPRRPARD